MRALDTHPLATYPLTIFTPEYKNTLAMHPLDTHSLATYPLIIFTPEYVHPRIYTP